MALSKQSGKSLTKHSNLLSMNGGSAIAFMPIKPVFAERIIDGTKKFEFRKTPIKCDLGQFIIYACAPVKKIIGVAEVEAVKVYSPSRMWEETKFAAGITRKAFRDYYQGKRLAYGIQIRKVISFSHWVDPKEIDNGFNVPQSFSYVDQAFLDRIMREGTKAGWSGVDAGEAPTISLDRRRPRNE